MIVDVDDTTTTTTSLTTTATNLPSNGRRDIRIPSIDKFIGVFALQNKRK